jgi:hypothetical protein
MDVRRYPAWLHRTGPLLTISLTSMNTVIVFWPVTGLDFQLQESTNFSLPNYWSPVEIGVRTNGSEALTPASVRGRQ